MKLNLTICMLFITLGSWSVFWAQAPRPTVLEIQELIQTTKQIPEADSAITYAQQVVLKSRNENYTEGLIQGYQMLGELNKDIGAFAEALRNYLQVIPILEASQDSLAIFRTYAKIGNIYASEQLNQEALDYFYMAQDLAVKAPKPEQIKVQENMATTYANAEKYDSSLLLLNGIYRYHYSNSDTTAMSLTLEKRVNNYLALKQYDAALVDNLEILRILVLTQDKNEIATAYNNIAYNYIKTNNLQKAVNNFGIAINVNPNSNYKKEATLLTNMAICYNNMGDQKTALIKLKEAQEILPNSEYQQLAFINQLISAIYMKGSDYYNALQYNAVAMDQAQKASAADLLSDAYRQAGEIHEDMYEFEKALDFYGKYLSIRDSILVQEKLRQQQLLQQQFLLEKAEKEIKLYQINEELKDLALQQSELEKERLALEATNLRLEAKKKTDQLTLLEKENQIKEARLKAQQVEAQTQLLLTEERLATEQKERELADLQQKEEMQTMQLANLEATELAQQKELEAETEKRKAQELELINQRRSNQLAYGIGLFLLLASILMLRSWFASKRSNKKLAQKNKEVEQQKATAEWERQKSDELLLNILPEPTAVELKEKGYATPKKYNLATVLFTDFSGFTTISEQLTPELLVRELNDCFVAFDEIIERYGLEKIKTIGDGYMCAGGIPIPNETNPMDTVRAALEMRAFMKQKTAEKQAAGMPYWKMRMGIHSGELVAGVVGKKKFVYDVWGDTVNVASRMESNGVEEKINISKTTYELIKDQFICTYRGAVPIKHKGAIEMYFVEKEKIAATV